MRFPPHQSSSANGHHKKTRAAGSDIAGTLTIPEQRSSFRLRNAFEASALPIVWLASLVLFGVLEPSTFLTRSNFISMFSSQATLLVLALAVVLPLTAGDFDLSAASVAGLAGMVVAVLNANHGWPIGLAILAALLVSALVGLLNAVFSVAIGLSTMVVTLGVGTFIEGIISVISGSQTISGVSPGLVSAVLGTGPFGAPWELYYALGGCVAMYYFLDHSPPGRRLLLAGRSREVSRLSGVHVTRLRISSLVACSTLAGVAGVLSVGTSGSADPSSYLGLLLPAYAAAFLGASTIAPGRFNAFGTAVAIFFLVTGITGLEILGAQTYVQDVFYGAALVAAVVIAHVVRTRRTA